MQYYPQPTQQAYPAQPQYTQPMYYPPQPDPEIQRQNTYRRNLRKNANSIGLLMLLFFGFELVFSLILSIAVMAKGIDQSSGEFLLLENGVISMVVFFLVGAVYCLIRKIRFSGIFPFEKIGAGLLAQLCVVGLCFSLMSNNVVSLVNGVFGLFGVENTGGSFDVGDQPNILLYFLVVAIMPALAEEFAFRGIAMGILRPFSEGLAILVSSALFALMHGNFVQLPFTFCCGLVFAFIDIKANSLLPSIIVHFFNNGLSVLSDILISYKIINEMTANLCYGILFVILGVLSFIFIKRFVSKDDGSFFTLKNGDTVLPYKDKIKTAVTSPTLIAFAAVMLIYSILTLAMGV